MKRPAISRHKADGRTTKTSISCHTNTRIGVHRETGWMVRAEVVGPYVPAPRDISGVEQGVTKAIGDSVALTVRARTEVVVTGTQYRSVEQLRAEGEDVEP